MGNHHLTIDLPQVTGHDTLSATMTDLPAILVVSPASGFSELIQQTLQESGAYQVQLANETESALLSLRTKTFALCILDAGVRGLPFPELARALRAIQPDLRLVVIPPENDLNHPSLAQIAPDGYLTRPFYLPDLVDTVATALLENTRSVHFPVSQAEPQMDHSFTEGWLENADQATLALTHLIRNSSALSALLLQKDQLWAFASKLPQSAAQELAQIVIKHIVPDGMNRREKASISRPESADIVRSIRLNETAGECILYATTIKNELVLALIFDGKTPFSVIRSQAGHLARALLTGQLITQMAPSIRQPRTVQAVPEPEGDIRPLMADVPSPKPVERPTASPTDMPIGEHSSIAQDLPTQDRGSTLINVEETQGSLVLQEHKSTDGLIEAPIPGLLEEEIVEFIQQPAPLNAYVRPELRPFTPALHGLYYACLLLPRLPGHHLTGDLSTELTQWLNQLCLAFGWRLEYIAVRPDYLTWIANVTPSTSPGNFVRLLRQHTSRRIFAEFPYLADQNPSGDFWAPGYLILSSAQPIPAQTIRDFIYHTRHEQGFRSSADSR